MAATTVPLWRSIPRVRTAYQAVTARRSTVAVTDIPAANRLQRGRPPARVRRIVVQGGRRHDDPSEPSEHRRRAEDDEDPDKGWPPAVAVREEGAQMAHTRS